MSLNNSTYTQSLGIPFTQYVTSSAGHALISSSTYFNDTSDNLPRYKDADGNVLVPFVSSSYAVTASYALNGGVSDTNFANTNLTFDGNREHDTNGNSLQISTDGVQLNESWFYMAPQEAYIGWGNNTITFVPSKIEFITTSSAGFTQRSRLKISSSNELVINENGDNYDFRVESDTNQNMLFVDGGTNRVGIGKSAPNAILDVNGDTIISGSTTIKNLGSTALNVIGSGSNNILEVNGSVGELLSVTDSNTGALFTVNNSASETMLQVNSDNTITYGIPSKPALQTTTTANVGTSPTVIYNIPTSSYTGAFVEYTITSESNARTGKIDAIWNSGTINFADVTGSGIGTTSGFTFAVILSGSNAVITGSASTTDWTVNAIIRSI